MLIQRGTIVGSYRIEGILGRGGMAVVTAPRLDIVVRGGLQ
jgi:hypothetical protein